MYRKTIISLLLIIFLAACSNTKENTQRHNDPINNTQPIHYQSDESRKNKTDQNINQKEVDDPSIYSDAFTNEESVMLSKALEERKEIQLAQVASTEDRVIIGIKLNKIHQNHQDHNVTQKIKKEIQDMIPDKQIIIYTDDTHWERMKNIDSKLKAKNGGNDILDFFKKDKKDK